MVDNVNFGQNCCCKVDLMGSKIEQNKKYGWDFEKPKRPEEKKKEIENEKGKLLK